MLSALNLRRGDPDLQGLKVQELCHLLQAGLPAEVDEEQQGDQLVGRQVVDIL